MLIRREQKGVDEFERARPICFKGTLRKFESDFSTHDVRIFQYAGVSIGLGASPDRNLRLYLS